MKHLTLYIPDHLELEEREIIRFLAAKMYETGRLSLGQAAELAGLSKVAFSEILADYGVSLINYPSYDIIISDLMKSYLRQFWNKLGNEISIPTLCPTPTTFFSSPAGCSLPAL